MKAVVISCLMAAALAQFQQPLKEASHFHAIVQPHLPRDPNVLDATQKFLHKFAELKALADAAPDDPVPMHSQAFQRPTAAPQRFAPQPTAAPQRFSHQHTAAPQRFSHQHTVSQQHFAPQPTAAPHFAPQPVAAPHFAPQHVAAPQFAPQPTNAPVLNTGHRFASPQNDFDVNSEISQLLAHHRVNNPTPAPTPAPAPAPHHHHHQPVQQAPVRSPASAFPSFSVQSSLGSHRQSSFHAHAPAPAPAPAPQHQSFSSPVNFGVSTTNQRGLVINPTQFPGPLADTVPAGVGRRVQNVGFTPEVAAAQRALAKAHSNILKQQASLARSTSFF